VKVGTNITSLQTTLPLKFQLPAAVNKYMTIYKGNNEGYIY